MASVSLAQMEVRGRLAEIDSLQSCGFGELNSGLQACGQMPFPVKSSC